MNSTTISSKYQIVIPREIREKLQLQPGQTVMVEATKEGDVLVKTESVSKSYYGKFRKTWGDGNEYLKTLREDANRDRT